MRTDLTGAGFRTRLRFGARKLRALVADLGFRWMPVELAAGPDGVTVDVDDRDIETNPQDNADQTECVVIEGAASKLARYSRLGVGLAVTVNVDGCDLVVEGDGLVGYLARLEPDVWDPSRARGDA